MPNNNDNENLQIVSVQEILDMPLSIPDYQRPYRWGTESVVRLIEDLSNAYFNGTIEYRMGSVILHKVKDENGEDTYDIVDGQQRLTTIAIMLFAYGECGVPSPLLGAKYSELSFNAIVNNLEIVRRKIKEMNPNNREKIFDYLLNQCTLVKIIIEHEQEAFQFFDSQNARGKALAPHDLLKSYHLREMRDEPENITVDLITKWENIEQRDLQDLFSNHLYPLVRWYKSMDGLNYSEKKIKAFKGIKKSSNYNFTVYHKAANLYVESFNTEGTYELMSGHMANQFQLTQPLIAGRRFFRYVLHYENLHDAIEKMLSSKVKAKELVKVDSGLGDTYVHDMFVNVLMFYIDKFSWEALTDDRLFFLYKWAFSLRVCMKAVYRESINKYVQGKNDKINAGLNIFLFMAEMKDPMELDTIILESISNDTFKKTKLDDTRYGPLYEKLFGKGDQL